VYFWDFFIVILHKHFAFFICCIVQFAQIWAASTGVNAHVSTCLLDSRYSLALYHAKALALYYFSTLAN
jgi:hypothetical protein